MGLPRRQAACLADASQSDDSAAPLSEMGEQRATNTGARQKNQTCAERARNASQGPLEDTNYATHHRNRNV